MYTVTSDLHAYRSLINEEITYDVKPFLHEIGQDLYSTKLEFRKDKIERDMRHAMTSLNQMKLTSSSKSSSASPMMKSKSLQCFVNSSKSRLDLEDDSSQLSCTVDATTAADESSHAYTDWRYFISKEKIKTNRRQVIKSIGNDNDNDGDNRNSKRLKESKLDKLKNVLETKVISKSRISSRANDSDFSYEPRMRNNKKAALYQGEDFSTTEDEPALALNTIKVLHQVKDGKLLSFTETQL